MHGLMSLCTQIDGTERERERERKKERERERKKRERVYTLVHSSRHVYEHVSQSI